MLTLTPYQAEEQTLWNQSVESSMNGTFLLDRRFMDYHSDRFKDCSLLFKKRDKVLACFPANYDLLSKTVYSHQGLTYGGLVLHYDTTIAQVMEIIHMMKDYYKTALNAENIVYKAIPTIYHSYRTENDLYALFLQESELTARGISSAVDLRHPIGYDKSRRRMLRKGIAANLNLYDTTDSSEIADYWRMLSHCLLSRHGVHPVHSASEIQLLTERFPSNIKLYVCRTSGGDLVAGAWIFLCNETVHTQYMTVSDEGKKIGALDFMVSRMIETYRSHFRYLDFGISTEDNGKYLNKNLIYQKEGLGGRGVCYDIYRIKI